MSGGRLTCAYLAHLTASASNTVAWRSNAVAGSPLSPRKKRTRRMIIFGSSTATDELALMSESDGEETGRREEFPTKERDPSNHMSQSPPQSHVEEQMDGEKKTKHEAVNIRNGIEDHGDGVEACASTH